MKTTRTHYQNLQVAENASLEVIKGAFRALSQKWHPDKNPDRKEEAERVSKIINAAYAVLSDVAARQEYDERLAAQREAEAPARGNAEAVVKGCAKRESQAATEQGKAEDAQRQSAVQSPSTPARSADMPQVPAQPLGPTPLTQARKRASKVNDLWWGLAAILLVILWNFNWHRVRHPPEPDAVVPVAAHISASSPAPAPATGPWNDYSASKKVDDAEKALERGDYATALTEDRPLAQQGYAEAQVILGIMYHFGKGVPVDDARAVEWFRKAAVQGFAPAQSMLGDMYAYGTGVPKDYAQAVDWSLKAAAQGNAHAQALLGRIYQLGWGVSKDYSEAVAWYRKSAEQENDDGQTGLCIMYNAGWGVPQNFTDAAGWCRKASGLGNAHAQRMLGLMYELGRGVPRDVAAAYALLDLSASVSDSIDNESESARNELMGRMTPEQIATGQALAKEMQRVGVLQALDAR